MNVSSLQLPPPAAAPTTLQDEASVPSVASSSSLTDSSSSSSSSSQPTVDSNKKRVRTQTTMKLKKCKREDTPSATTPTCNTKKEKQQEKEREKQIPTIRNLDQTKDTNYSVLELKAYLKSHGLYTTGTKPVLHDRLFTFLKTVCRLIQVQAVFRGYFVRKVYGLFRNYQSMVKNCVNEQDFYSFEPLTEIHPFQLICVKEPEGSVYGFDVASVIQYKNKLDFGVTLTNPYTRSQLEASFFADLATIECAAKLGIISTVVDIDTQHQLEALSFEKQVEMKAISLFQQINSLGNYSDASWFLTLSRSRLFRLIRELYDIWNFRLNIQRDTKRAICPPHGSPFDLGRNLNTTTASDLELQDIVLSIFENFVYRGINRDSQALGCFYVLGALTLVSSTAANAAPWLYQSFVY